MSLHIAAQPGDIAETVLLPGDPLRAKVIAENFLENAVCHNEIRGMLGFTGTYKGKKISVQGTGMGIPSISIYVNELLMLGAKRLVRIGTCGSLQPHIELRDLVLAMSTSTDSGINHVRFSGRTFAPTASFPLLLKANEKAGQMGFRRHVGNVLSTDTFYDDDPDGWKLWANFGVLAVEMEAAGLYTLAAKHHVEALAIMTVSDSLVTGGKISPSDRQTAFMDMVKLALDTVS